MAQTMNSQSMYRRQAFTSKLFFGVSARRRSYMSKLFTTQAHVVPSFVNFRSWYIVASFTIPSLSTSISNSSDKDAELADLSGGNQLTKCCQRTLDDTLIPAIEGFQLRIRRFEFFAKRYLFLNSGQHCKSHFIEFF